MKVAFLWAQFKYLAIVRPLFPIFLAVILAGCDGTQPPPTSSPTALPAATAAPTRTPAAAATVVSSATAPVPSPSPATTTPLPTPGPAATPTDDRQPSVSFGYTYLQPDGNRLVAGRGTLPETRPLDIPLAGEPEWVLAAPVDGEAVWAVVLADGRVQGFRIVDKTVTEIPINPEQLLPGMPPLLKVEAGVPTLLNAPVDAASLLTHPVPLSDKRLAFVHAGGAVMIWEKGDLVSLEVNALPDARLLGDESERLLLLTDPGERYGHGVLGDAIEAAGVTLIDTQPALQVSRTIPIPEPSVVEGIAPIWADLSGDGQREIIVTLSNAQQGAQIVVFNEAGEQIAAGPAIGSGFRWRHQIAVAPFGPKGELELVDVLTPHIGGTVEFYQLEEDSLRVVAQVQGYTSHVIRTRNLDMAAAGDFDGDERLELLLPNQARTELGGIRRTAEGAEVVWTMAVEGVVNTNLAAVSLANDSIAVGVGRADGVLRLWLP